MLPPPPRSTLFPYTTLFRSHLAQRVEHRRADVADHGRPRRAQREQADEHHDRAVKVDRKSTRLNSSHVSISYAVFCLKKKNNTPYWKPCRTTWNSPHTPSLH